MRVVTTSMNRTLVEGSMTLIRTQLFYLFKNVSKQINLQRNKMINNQISTRDVMNVKL